VKVARACISPEAMKKSLLSAVCPKYVRSGCRRMSKKQGMAQELAMQKS